MGTACRCSMWSWKTQYSFVLVSELWSSSMSSLSCTVSHSLAKPEMLYVALTSRKMKAGALGLLKAHSQNQYDVTSAPCYDQDKSHGSARCGRGVLVP